MEISGTILDRRAPRKDAAFTMVEIAISLAIIGVALVAILGVLPIGLRAQRDNREGTLINQDATVFTEAVRNGARGMDDLTNYVYAITNYWTEYDDTGKVIGGGGNVNNGYAYSAYSLAPGFFTATGAPITNGANIVGLLSTPEYTDTYGSPAPNLFNGGYSNHIVAYVHSLNGPAVEKPPQNNQLLIQSSFSYRIFCDNLPVAIDTPPIWSSSQTYNFGDKVTFIANGFQTFWQWNSNGPSINIVPTNYPSSWVRNYYSQSLTANLHELRLRFRWPQLPNGGLGLGQQTFRTMIAGQLVTDILAGQTLYFFQSQSFPTNAP